MYSIAFVDNENNLRDHGRPDLVASDPEVLERYCHSARDAVIRDILLGTADISCLDLAAMHLEADIYQVVIYEKYSFDQQDAFYSFADLLRVTNQDNNSYDNVRIRGREVLLLKGSFAIRKFNDFLDRYEQELRPQKDSPLDSLFIAYGRLTDSLGDVPQSYGEALRLMNRRFFCEPRQHTIGYPDLPDPSGSASLLGGGALDTYVRRLLDAIQVFNRSAVEETLSELAAQLAAAPDSTDDIRLFLIDLYLQIKQQISHLYGNSSVPFAGNADIIKFIGGQSCLYEILRYFTEQFELIMSSLGTSTRNSVLDDILHYIDHNYEYAITLEGIASLFGYNSAYLGKIFRRKMGQNFNSYLDQIRIERAKELLQSEDAKIYRIAEHVGYRNVDYFHIKFKKYVGISPAEYRRQARAAQES